MSLGTQIVREIDAMYKPAALGAVIRWCDANHESAWTNAIDRLDRAIVECGARFDYASLKAEYEFFQRKTRELLTSYEAVHPKGTRNSIDEFLNGVS